MEPITASKTTTNINTQQIYPQPKSKKKVRIVVDSSSNSDEGANGTEGREGNEVLAESGNISSSGEDIFNEEDPFLLVSLRASTPSRPKNVSYLYIIALLDLSIITVFTFLLVHKDKKGHWHWRKAAWDWVALGLLRFIVVVWIASSKWIQQLRWILGGVCCYRKQIDEYRLILLISSFLFCQIHWIAYVVITTDSRRKAKYLRDQSIVFEEESRDNSYADENNNEDAISNNNHRSRPTLRSYNATANRNDEIDV